jgi:hypothetical protein
MLTGVALTPVMRISIHNTTSRVLIEDSARCGVVVAGHPRWRDRFAARWCPGRLDRALALGTPPEASPALALRAQRLTELAERHSIADALRRVLRDARDGARPSPARITPSRTIVAAASEELARLADTLSDPGPVTAQGVAQAHLLLTDGTGPLYSPRGRPGLRPTAASAVRALRPWPA